MSRTTVPVARRVAGLTAATLLLVVVLGACGSGDGKDAASVRSGSSGTATSTTTVTGAAATSSCDLTSGFRQAKWASTVTVTYSDGKIRYQSNGLPNHARDAEYALPNAGVVVPSATTATAGADPTVAQSYDYSIPTCATKAAATTETSLGVIGVMISGATLFNPYEGDNTTVATQSNFSVKDASGNDVYFLDTCSGHPTPMGQYHYHALPKCVTAQVDAANGPSHMIGIAFDGYPIYGDRALNGKQLTAADLDACNGITSATPEFPTGVYHYVLLDVADSTSSIRCFTGTVDASLTSTAGGGMAGMPGMRP